MMILFTLVATAIASPTYLHVVAGPDATGDVLVGPVEVLLETTGAGIQVAIPHEEEPLFLLLDRRTDRLLCHSLYTRGRRGHLKPAKHEMGGCDAIPEPGRVFRSVHGSLIHGFSIVVQRGPMPVEEVSAPVPSGVDESEAAKGSERPNGP